MNHMDEDGVLTLIFASLGIIMVATSITFLIPKGNLTGLAISIPTINPILFLTIPFLIGALILVFKLPRAEKDPLTSYIKNSRKRGLSELQITDNLAEVGWNKEDFEKYLK